jgi:hypothetical protein
MTKYVILPKKKLNILDAFGYSFMKIAEMD